MFSKKNSNLTDHEILLKLKKNSNLTDHEKKSQIFLITEFFVPRKKQTHKFSVE